MASHLGQSISNHVTLELWSGLNGGYGVDRLGWVRILPNGSLQGGPSGGNFVVPFNQCLVITDVDWQYHDIGTNHAGVEVTLRLFVVGGREEDVGSRLMESTIVLSGVGESGTVTSWTAGGVFGPGTKIGIDTIPLTSRNRLQHALLHGYLIASGGRPSPLEREGKRVSVGPDPIASGARPFPLEREGKRVSVGPRRRGRSR
jgi:hypothetical protein